jgi:hypothetical protein
VEIGERTVIIYLKEQAKADFGRCNPAANCPEGKRLSGGAERITPAVRVIE